MPTSRLVSRRPFGPLLGVLFILAGWIPASLATPAAALALSTDVVISQVYGAGGNAGAALRNDYVELFNRGTGTVALTGLSIQYASATGTGAFSNNPITLLAGSLAPGQFYLVQLASGGAIGALLPTADVIGTVNMSGTAGKVILASTTAGVACNGGSIACSADQLALIKDLVGWGGANFFESAAAPATSATTAIFRDSNGCAETDDNAADFTAAAPAPRNTASPVNPCQQTVLNEVLASTTGTDVEYIELYGLPGASLAGLSLVYVEANNTSSPGTIDFRYDFAAGTTLGVNGFYLIGTTAGLQTFYGVTPNADIATNSLENSSATVALVETSSIVGTTVSGSEAVRDTVAITDATASTFFFSAPVVGPDGSFFPAGVRRVTDGVDTDTAADWVISDFNLGTANTPTAGVAARTISVNDVSLNEGNSGTTSFDFTVSLTVAAGAGGVTFDIATADNSATVAGNDYVAKSLTGQTIPAGSSTYAFSVLVNGDAVVEPSETFFVNLANVTGAVVADGQGQGTIVNDDVAAATPVHDIQGSGDTSAPGTFTVEAIVVGDYQTQGSGQLRGFFVQEEDADTDADPATSEGIFVFCSSCPVPVSVGDKVRVTGSASEFFNMSQLTASTASSVSVLSSGNPLPTPASVQLPVPGLPGGDLAAATAAINAYFEPFEGMLVSFPDILSVSEYFELARYGQVILTEGGRPRTFTDANDPSVAGFIANEIQLASRTIILDDTDNRQNRPSDVPNTAYYHPVPGLSTGNYFRGGDTITNLTGVLHWSFAGQSGTDAWRIRPVTEAYTYAFTPENARPATAPSVGGDVKVASFNVLNYFLTVDTTASDNVGVCSPSGTADCRGADSTQELARQRAKLLAALTALDADVLGLMEMENTPGVEPLADIVAGLPGYDYIDTGVIGGDAIRVGLIYDATTVTPIGPYAILDSGVDPRFIDTLNRPALAQTFEEIATGGRFTVVVNHLKSKGSACPGDPDLGDGQGNCNQTRTLAAQALADWAASDPTGTAEPDTLIIGDLNSYANEDPIVALEDAGYTNLVASFGGPDAYGYVFDGQLGYLDHALSNASLTPQVTGVAEWHINADEIPLFDYNDDVRDTGEAAFEEESDTLPLYEPDAFRTSDHDPVIIGLDLLTDPVVSAAPASQTTQYSDPITDVGVTATEPDGDTALTASAEWSVDGGGFTAGLPGGLTLSDADCDPTPCAWTLSGTADTAPGTYTIRFTVTDSNGDDSFADVTITVTQEDARATYTGALYVSTSSPSSSAAKVTLAATIRDITAVTADAAYDAYAGDIRNATVTFVNRDTDQPIPGCGDLPIGLVDLDDPKTGTATCIWSVDIGAASSVTYTVGIVVDGYYTRDSGSEDDIVTVAKPLGSNFISGGGNLELVSSAGQKAGDPGTKASFGFGVRFNKGGTNLQGGVNVIVRRTESDGVHTYQIKTNRLTSLSSNASTGEATFTGKASIQDITDPDHPVSVDGNAVIKLTMDDNGDPGAGDTLGITVWNKSGGLWFASAWNGVMTVEQVLAGGNLRVR